MLYFRCAISETSGLTTLKICLTFHMKSMKAPGVIVVLTSLSVTAVTVDVCLSMQEQFSLRRVIASCAVLCSERLMCRTTFLFDNATSSLMYTKLYVYCYFVMEFLSTHIYVFIYVLSSTDMNVL